MHVPSYAAWLEQTDQSDAYAYMARLMKLLQWQRPAKRWVLKTPHHLEFLDLAKKHFEDVHFLWTHRNVYQSIPSFLSMVSYARRLFSNQVDPGEVAGHWLRKTGFMLSRAIEFHKRNSNTSLFTHIQYEKLIEDPHTILQTIYQHKNEAISPDLEQIFREAEQINPQGKYGKHAYNLEHFGLNRGKVDTNTIEYQHFQQAMKTT